MKVEIKELMLKYVCWRLKWAKIITVQYLIVLFHEIILAMHLEFLTIFNFKIILRIVISSNSLMRL